MRLSLGLYSETTSGEESDEFLDELILLADTAGAKIVRRIIQERQSPDPAFFIGKGKAEEIKIICESEDINLVIFDDDLSGVQIRNLEGIIDRRVLDRSGLILDIFGIRARTREAKLQVEMAQLRYNMSRLAGQWQHFSKQYGVIGTEDPAKNKLKLTVALLRKEFRRSGKS